MRGTPLWQALGVALALALVGVPVWSLTRPRTAAQPPPPPAATRPAGPIQVSVTSSAPAQIELRHSGVLVWQGGSPSTEQLPPLSLPASDDLIDLVVSVHWSGLATDQAVRLRLTQDDELLNETTLWGRERADEVISFTVQ